MAEPVRKHTEREDLQAFNRTVPYVGFLGLDIEIENGRVLTILRKNPDNVGNPVVPMIHGGAVGALLEHAAMAQLLHALKLDPERLPRIVNVSIDYLRPCLLEDTFAQGFIIRQGRRVANVRVEAWQSDAARLVAAAHLHFLLPRD